MASATLTATDSEDGGLELQYHRDGDEDTPATLCLLDFMEWLTAKLSEPEE